MYFPKVVNRNISRSGMSFMMYVAASVILVSCVYTVNAADTGTVTATVSATNLSVSVSGDGAIAFGSVALDTATTTAGNSDTQTVNNLGSDATLNVKATNATGGTTWTLGATNGSDIYTLEVSTTTGLSYMALQGANTYLTASSTFPSLTSGNLDFRLTTPNSSTDFTQKSITITIQVAP